MDLKDRLEIIKNITVINECLIDYTGPICIFGTLDLVFIKDKVTIISATLSEDNFAIINGKVPSWVNSVSKNKSDNNILVITDIDKVSLEKQGLLIDIIENNHISTVELPKNLKVVLHSNTKCELNDKIRPLLECYNIDL